MYVLCLNPLIWWRSLVEAVTLVNPELLPPCCQTAWCFRRSMGKRGHCSVLVLGWSAQPASVVSTVLSHRPGRSRPMSKQLGRLSGLCMRGSVSA